MSEIRQRDVGSKQEQTPVAPTSTEETGQNEKKDDTKKDDTVSMLNCILTSRL